jgi:anti-sigma B factor antagonist
MVMSDEFEIDSQPVDGTIEVLRVRGRLDTKTASQLLHRCAAVRNAGHDLVLNLSGVSFIASSGIGALLALTEKFKESGGGVRFVQLSTAVESVIQLLNLNAFLGIDASEEEALKALESRKAA